MAAGHRFRREDLTPEEEDLIQKVEGSSYTRGKRVKVFPPGIALSRNNNLEKLDTLKLHDDDVFIVTPPKCGTTWMQEIVWLLRHDLDVEGAKLDLFYRCPNVDTGLLEAKLDPYPENLPLTKDNVKTFTSHSFEFINRMARPRCIKSHLPISLLPADLLDRCKVVFVARNVKDMLVSYFHIMSSMNPAIKEAGFNAFADLFQKGLALFSPGISMMLDAFKLRDHPNMFFITYEELKQDFDASARRLAKFLGVATWTDEKFALLKDRTSFKNFRANEAVNMTSVTKKTEDFQFVRKGIVGDWRNHFDEETNKKWDEWIKKELSGTGYKMTFEQ